MPENDVAKVLNWLYQDQADPSGLEEVLADINNTFRQRDHDQLLEVYTAVDDDPELDNEDRDAIQSAMVILIDLVELTSQQAVLKLTSWINEHNADGSAHEYLASAYERMYGPE